MPDTMALKDIEAILRERPGNATFVETVRALLGEMENAMIAEDHFKVIYKTLDGCEKSELVPRDQLSQYSPEMRVPVRRSNPATPPQPAGWDWGCFGTDGPSYDYREYHRVNQLVRRDGTLAILYYEEV